MEQYISKFALVAEIENLENTYKKCPTRNSYEEGLKDGRLIGYKDALYKINTLEVKGVDFDEEFSKYHIGIYNPFNSGADIYEFAKHFFELGMQVSNKAQKGE